MALSQSQRLRKAAQKAARRKEIVAQKKKSEAPRARAEVPSAYARQAPIDSCVMTEEIFELGLGWVVLARRLPMDTIGASFFLVDGWRLGVKDAFYRTFPTALFEAQMEVALGVQTPVEIEPSRARKLLHDAAAFAKSLGFAPNQGFALAEQLFGDIPMADETFSFGNGGKPFFVDDPSEEGEIAALPAPPP